MKKIHASAPVFALIATLAPLVALAQHPTLNSLATEITGYLNQALTLMMSFAVVVFVYYVIQYYIKPNDERKAAGSYVLYSVIGFFVILSIWGLVAILTNTFGLQNDAPNMHDLQNLFPR